MYSKLKYYLIGGISTFVLGIIGIVVCGIIQGQLCAEKYGVILSYVTIPHWSLYGFIVSAFLMVIGLVIMTIGFIREC
jgi:hypothetical protein